MSPWLLKRFEFLLIFFVKGGKLKCCFKSWVIDIPFEHDFGSLLLMCSQVN